MRDFFNKDPDRKEINKDTVVLYDVIEALVGADGKGGVNECLVRFVHTDEARYATPVKERIRGAVALLELLNRGVADEQTKMNKRGRD